MNYSILPRRWTCLGLTAACALLAACPSNQQTPDVGQVGRDQGGRDGGSSVGSEAGADASGGAISGTIGQAGGEITLGGAKLTIPAGALDADTEITVQALSPSEAQAVAAGLELRSAVYAFTPHGLTFQLPVLIEFPYTDDGDPVGAVKKPAPDQGSWETVSATFDGKLARLETESFSLYLARRTATLSCEDAFYQGAWNTMKAALSAARTCTPSTSGPNCGDCVHEARITIGGSCSTLGFAPYQAAADQMVAAYQAFLQATVNYPCRGLLMPCDSDPAFSAPSYCGKNGKCAKCPFCDDNPPPPDPCVGTPCVTCNESTDTPCLNQVPKGIQIYKEDISGETWFGLRYTDDKVQTCPILALVFIDSDSLDDQPEFQFHELSPGSSVTLGPHKTIFTNQTWYYKLVWAVYLDDVGCSGTPMLGCTDTDLSFCPATVSHTSFQPPSASAGVQLYRVPWWTGSEWRPAAHLINRAKDCLAQVTVRITNKTADPPFFYDEVFFVGSGSAIELGPIFETYSVPYQQWRYQILQASYSP